MCTFNWIFFFKSVLDHAQDFDFLEWKTRQELLMELHAIGLPLSSQSIAKTI